MKLEKMTLKQLQTIEEQVRSAIADKKSTKRTEIEGRLLDIGVTSTDGIEFLIERLLETGKDLEIK